MSRWLDDFPPHSIVKSAAQLANWEWANWVREAKKSARKWKSERTKRRRRKEIKKREREKSRQKLNSVEKTWHMLEEYLLPRSVLGPANNCLNLSRRDASLSVIAGVPDVFWSAMRATSGMTGGRWGRDRCLWRAACSPAASGGRTEETKDDGLNKHIHNKWTNLRQHFTDSCGKVERLLPNHKTVLLKTTVYTEFL